MIWLLLVLFQLKHFLADYPLQTPYMLGKFKNTGWVLPLATHCGVHVLFTLTISLFYTQDLTLISGLLILDFTVHFIMDRIKASPSLLGRYEAMSKGEFRGSLESRSLYSQGLGHGKLNETCELGIKKLDRKFKENTYFWYSLGLDQMIHHLTDIAIIYILVTYAI